MCRIYAFKLSFAVHVLFAKKAQLLVQQQPTLCPIAPKLSWLTKIMKQHKVKIILTFVQLVENKIKNGLLKWLYKKRYCGVSRLQSIKKTELSTRSVQYFFLRIHLRSNAYSFGDRLNASPKIVFVENWRKHITYPFSLLRMHSRFVVVLRLGHQRSMSFTSSGAIFFQTTISD